MGSEVLKQLFNCINLLTSKDSVEHSSPTEHLQRKLEAVHNQIDSEQHLQSLLQEVAPSICVPTEGSSYTYIFYLEHCLAFLAALAKLLKEAPGEHSEQHGVPKLSPNTLSISQQQRVQCLLQFVVGLGVQPNLLPGVGVPSKIQWSKEQVSSTPCTSHRVLVMTTKTLLSCADVAALWDLVIHKHLVDILAALIQLCHAPIKKIPMGDDGYDRSPSDVPFDLERLIRKCREGDVRDADLIAEMHADRSALTAHLRRLLENTFQPLLVRDVLLLMSYPTLLEKHRQQDSQVKRLPKWLKAACGQILSDSLLRKDGLWKVFLGVRDAWSMSSSDDAPKEHDWMKCEAFARTIANVPSSSGLTAESYYERMGPQVVKLVHKMVDRGADRLLCNVTYGILGAMLESRPRLSSRWVLRALFNPLLQCMRLQGAQLEESIQEATEKDLGTCVELVHGILSKTHVNPAVLDAVVPLLPVFYEVHVLTQGSVSYLRSLCETVIATTLVSQETEFAVSLLHWCVFRERQLQQCGSLRRDVAFALGPSGGVELCRRLQALSEDEWVEQVDKITLALKSVLEKESCKHVATAFFLLLLKRLNAVLKQSSYTKSTASSSLLEMEARSADLKRNLLLLHLVQGLSDVAADGLPQNLETVVDFVNETLERGLELQQESEGSSLASQSMLFSLTILGVVLANADMEEGNDVSVLQKCLPSLSNMASKCKDPDLRGTARNLQLAIATHGIVGTPAALCVSRQRLAHDPETKTIDSARLSRISDIAAAYGLCIETDTGSDPMLESRDLKQDRDTEVGKSAAELSSKGDVQSEVSKTPFEEMWMQLQDPLIPVRGHAFISLRRLVELRDAETLKHREALVEACHAAIQEGDSYIYLSAIQALAALADENTDSILHVVANEMVSEKLSVGARLNLGEVLLRTCRNLGEMAPKYSNLLANCFLRGTKDPDPVVRASGASNLGELCGKLGYSFATITQEVLSCLRSLMRTDPENTVRRAAVLAMASLIKGMGSKLFSVIPEELKALHQELKQLYSHTSDDVARLQAQLAIEELNRVTREFLTQRPPMEKTIRVLDFPH